MALYWTGTIRTSNTEARFENGTGTRFEDTLIPSMKASNQTAKKWRNSVNTSEELMMSTRLLRPLQKKLFQVMCSFR